MKKSEQESSGAVEQCGCMATRHKFNTSCTGCGWIACEQYTLVTCAKCKAELLPQMTAEDATNAGFNETTVNAYKMLDKLLQFDKENAQRTHVHDAQADYYETGTWLTEEEKEDIDRREKMRLDAKNHRAHRKVNINFDIAGRRVVDFVQEEEGGDGAEDVPKGVTICSPFADNDGGRPEWMYEEDSTVFKSAGSHYASAAKANIDPATEAAMASDPSTAEIDDAGADELPVYENVELEKNRGKAAEVYRSMKKRWETEAAKS